MDKKSKPVLGLEAGKIIKNPNNYFSDSEKHFIIQEFLSSGWSKAKIWKKYTGRKEEGGYLLGWMRKLGYEANDPRSPIFDRKMMVMDKKKPKKEDDDFDTLQLKKRIADLEGKLKDADMKAVAYSTMVDIAEKEFNISIRKKLNTKPSKK